jgi:signal transduction histidine kinase
MLNEKDIFRQRLNVLFEDIGRLADSPHSATPHFRTELKNIEARVRDLEAQLDQMQTQERINSSSPYEGWEAFLDAIHQKERYGFAFDQENVSSYFENIPESGAGFQKSISVLEKQVGTLYLESSSGNPLTEEDQKLVARVADQLAQRVENIRLLAEASRARSMAEEATRQLTRENWLAYLASRNESGTAYIYDSNEVTPLTDSNKPDTFSASEPLAIRGEAIGHLGVAGKPHVSPAEADLIAAIASQVSTHIESLRLNQEVERDRLQIQQMVMATSAQTGEKFFLTLVEQLTTSLNMKHSFVAQLDSKNNQAHMLSLVAHRSPAEPYTYSLEDTPCQNVINGGLCLYPERVQAAFPFDPNLAALNAQCYLGIPLYSAAGRILGHLAVLDTEPMRDESRRKAILQVFAARAGAELERQLAEAILEKRASELQTVAQLSTTTSTVLDPDKLLQDVVDVTKERFDLYHAHIYLIDEVQETLRLAAGAGDVGRQMIAEGWNIPLGHEQSIVARTARDKRSVIANDIRRDKDSTFLSNRLLPDTRSEMAIPMIVGDNLLGVFDVQATSAGYFTEEDANIYTTLASQVGVALQNARLYVEQASTVTQLRELDRLKSSFLANMSHELRTPLNSILGFSDVILEGLDGPLTEYMHNDIQLIQKNGKHLLHLINDVLDMAKIESGRMNLHLERFKVHQILEEATSITSTLVNEKNISILIAEDSDQDLEIFADGTRLRQVMINLVNNAIKFTEKGKIVLSAKLLNNTKTLITVKDTGIGIPQDKLEAVFQEFTQVDASTTRKAGGTGLGLPISRRLVEMHGGRLWAESSGVNGEGTTFLVELPLEARITEAIEKQER